MLVGEVAVGVAIEAASAKCNEVAVQESGNGVEGKVSIGLEATPTYLRRRLKTLIYLCRSLNQLRPTYVVVQNKLTYLRRSLKQLQLHSDQSFESKVNLAINPLVNWSIGPLVQKDNSPDLVIGQITTL